MTEGIEIEKLAKGEIRKFIELILVFEDVFEMENFKIPTEDYLKKVLAGESFFAFVALKDGKVVGGLTSYIMHQYYYETPLVYIFDLAVNRDCQRKGIGRMLIEANNAYCKEIGAEAVMVQADVPDEHAIEFYRSTGASGQDVIHFEYQVNERKE